MPEKNRPRCARCNRIIKKGELVKHKHLNFHARCAKSAAKAR